VYPKFTDQKKWSNWNHSVIALAHAHDLSHVLNKEYIPITPSDIALFKLQQDSMYTVFNTCILTDIGKMYVHEHEVDLDAQAVYRKLCLYAQGSTKANLTKDAESTYLSMEKLDSCWHGSSTGFIINW
jgi:hypothetical protein